MPLQSCLLTQAPLPFSHNMILTRAEHACHMCMHATMPSLYHGSMTWLIINVYGGHNHMHKPAPACMLLISDALAEGLMHT